MTDDSYTVSELAACVSNGSPERYDLSLRRLRHWAQHGVLETSGALHVGTGRSRQFGAEQAYVAAVLMRLVDMGLAIGAIKQVARVIAHAYATDSETRPLWEAAKRRGVPGERIFARLSIRFDDSGMSPATIWYGLAQGTEGPNAPGFYMDHEVVITLDLTGIFQTVKL
jgi:hypothetical protein